MKLNPTVELIRDRLTESLQALELTIEDDSAAHAGHAGARQGGGHFRVRIVTQLFANKPLVARHRMVYHPLADLMKRDIHALTIDAFTPGEVNAVSS